MATAQDLMTALARERMALTQRIKALNAAEQLLRAGLGMSHVSTNGTKPHRTSTQKQEHRQKEQHQQKEHTQHKQKGARAQKDLFPDMRDYILGVAMTAARMGQPVTRKELIATACQRFPRIISTRISGRVQWTLGMLRKEGALKQCGKGAYSLT